jgi:hypothetical protein
MATTTPNYGWAVPTSTDLVKDGATAIETLGDAIDASLVDLRGGTTGQVLRKQSNTQMDFEWATSSSGLTLISTTTFTGVTSVSLPADTFTSTYMNYRINFNLDSCTVGMTLTARMRVAGADNTQARYQQMSTGANSAGADVNVGQLNQTSWSLGVWTNLAQNFIVDVVRPKQVSETSVMGQFAIDNTTVFVSRAIGLKQNESIAFDSMSFIASTGNIAGSINVYGYAQ